MENDTLIPTSNGTSGTMHRAALIGPISAAPAGASSFDAVVGELGRPIPTRDLPPAEGIVPGRVAMIGGRHGIEVLGPPLPVGTDGRHR